MKSSSHDTGYFESLFLQHDNHLVPEGEKEEMIRDNEINYIQAYQGPLGPLKYMSE